MVRNMFHRFGGQNPRDAVGSLLLMYAVLCFMPTFPDGASDHLTGSPVMVVYCSLIALAREADRAHASAASLATADERVLAAALLHADVAQWINRASTSLDECPEVFQELLRPRFADRVALAWIGNAPCSSPSCMRVC